MTTGDINSRQDIERLVDHFYSVAMSDTVIGHHFAAMDMAAHAPVMCDFWEKAIFGRPVYFGNPLIVHQTLDAKVRMEPGHFVRWVEIFVEAVDGLFSGENADRAKLRARMVADSINQRLNEEHRLTELDIHGRAY